jgi:F-type H+-transporting ATPase subunit gamma
MGAGKKEVQRRIKAVRNIQQITKAMKMVAAAKLRRVQDKVISARPYARELREALARLASSELAVTHPLLEKRDDVKTVGYVVISADRGLAGSYNVNVIRRTAAALRKEERPYILVTVGRKARDFFRRRGYTISGEFVNIGEEPTFMQAREIAHQLMGYYLQGAVDEVRLVYTEFQNALQQRPVEVRLLPLDPPREEVSAGNKSVIEYIYIPVAEEVLNQLLPKFVETQLYQAILEAKASEQGARMTAMGSATDNAAELIDKYTLQYNRARQAAITNEIAERRRSSSCGLTQWIGQVRTVAAFPVRSSPMSIQSSTLIQLL